MTFGGRGTAVLNSNLCMQNNAVSAARLHATEGVTAHCISASSLVTAGCVSASGLMTAETVVARNSVHVGKVLTIEGGAIQQQGGGRLLLGEPLGVSCLNTNLTLLGNTLTAGTVHITGGGVLDTDSGVVRRCNGASLTLAACLGGVSLIDSNLCLQNKSLTAVSVSVTAGVIHRPSGAQFSLGQGGEPSVLTSHLEVHGNLKAVAVLANGYFNASVPKLGSIDVSEIDGALTALSAFDYLLHKKNHATIVGMDAEQVRKAMPSLVAPINLPANYVDYSCMVPLMGAAIKDLYAQRTRTGRLALVGGTGTADIAQTHGQAFATLVTKAPPSSVAIFVQNETGWAQVRAHCCASDNRKPKIVIQCADTSSVDRVVYMLHVEWC